MALPSNDPIENQRWTTDEITQILSKPDCPQEFRKLPLQVIKTILSQFQPEDLRSPAIASRKFNQLNNDLNVFKLIAGCLQIPLIDADDIQAIKSYLDARESASFETCYEIVGDPPKLLLKNLSTITAAHQAVEGKIDKLTRLHGDHPFVRKLKKSIHTGSVKYPEDFAIVDVLQAAMEKMPAGSWVVHSSPTNITKYLILQDEQTAKVLVIPYRNPANMDQHYKDLMQKRPATEIIRESP